VRDGALRASEEKRRSRNSGVTTSDARGGRRPPYDLLVETGPQHKSTLVHVPELLGCVVYARTTEDAVGETPLMIERYVAALRRHGEKIATRSPVTTRVAELSEEGGFIGAGRFTSDLEPVSQAEVARFSRWLGWSREDLLEEVAAIPRKALAAKPERGRPIRAILEHVLGADKSYVYGAFGVTKSVGDPTNAALRGELDLEVALREERLAAVERLRGATPEERTRVRRGGASLYTLRRMLRAMLEHEWEHRVEIAARLAQGT